MRQRSGHWTFRVWFGGATSPLAAREDVVRKMRELGAQLEWHSKSLLAISAPSDELAQRIADYLYAEAQQGQVVYETGRTTARPEVGR